MYTLSCQDMGMKECPFVATGETKEEVVEAMKDHGMEAHADQMEGMSEDEMMSTMEANIKEEA